MLRRRRPIAAMLGVLGAAAVVVGVLVQLALPPARRTVRFASRGFQQLTVVEVHPQPAWPLGLVLGGAVLVGAAILVLLLRPSARDRIRDV